MEATTEVVEAIPTWVIVVGVIGTAFALAAVGAFLLYLKSRTKSDDDETVKKASDLGSYFFPKVPKGVDPTKANEYGLTNGEDAIRLGLYRRKIWIRRVLGGVGLILFALAVSKAGVFDSACSDMKSNVLSLWVLWPGALSFAALMWASKDFWVQRILFAGLGLLLVSIAITYLTSNSLVSCAEHTLNQQVQTDQVPQESAGTATET